MKRSSILLLATQVPFSRGGAEILLDKLAAAISETGHNVDILSLPFFAEPKKALINEMLKWRSLSLDYVSGRNIDLIIPTKFPTYFVKHSNKVAWLIHQHRQAYDLIGTRYGDFSHSEEDESIRQAILKGDIKALSETKKLFTISETVSKRLSDFLAIESSVLRPPLPFRPPKDEITKGDFILPVGRLCSAKRVDLIIKSLPLINNNLKLKVVGVPDEPGYEDYLKSEISKHHLNDRVKFLGAVSNKELSKLYSSCFCVFYSPYDEDYGFVTYEAASHEKPLITTTDSGFVREVVASKKLGLIVEPDTISISNACNYLFENSESYGGFVKNCRLFEIPYDWREVSNKLLLAGGISID